MLVHIPFVGVLTWQLIFNYDNSNNSAPIEHSIRTRKFHSISMGLFREEIARYAHLQTRTESEMGVRMGFDPGVSYRAVSVNFDTRVDFSEELASFVMTTREQRDVRWEGEYEESRKYHVGPHSTLELYQKYFKAPGMSYACNALSTTKKPDEAVEFHMIMEAIVFITDLKVVYGSKPSDAPPDRVREVGGLSDDINHGFGGDYVWLVPVYTTNKEHALTGLDLFIQDVSDALPDLARGAGGEFRHLRPVRDQRQRRKITELGLMRRKDGEMHGPGLGYEVKTADLNRERGGDWLYVVAREVEV